MEFINPNIAEVCIEWQNCHVVPLSAVVHSEHLRIESRHCCCRRLHYRLLFKRLHNSYRVHVYRRTSLTQPHIHSLCVDLCGGKHSGVQKTAGNALFTDRIGEGDNAIASIRLSVCFHSVFGSE